MHGMLSFSVLASWLSNRTESQPIQHDGDVVEKEVKYNLKKIYWFAWLCNFDGPLIPFDWIYATLSWNTLCARCFWMYEQSYGVRHTVRPSVLPRKVPYCRIVSFITKRHKKLSLFGIRTLLPHTIFLFRTGNLPRNKKILLQNKKNRRKKEKGV